MDRDMGFGDFFLLNFSAQYDRAEKLLEGGDVKAAAEILDSLCGRGVFADNERAMDMAVRIRDRELIVKYASVLTENFRSRYVYEHLFAACAKGDGLLTDALTAGGKLLKIYDREYVSGNCFFRMLTGFVRRCAETGNAAAFDRLAEYMSDIFGGSLSAAIENIAVSAAKGTDPRELAAAAVLSAAEGVMAMEAFGQSGFLTEGFPILKRICAAAAETGVRPERVPLPDGLFSMRAQRETEGFFDALSPLFPCRFTAGVTALFLAESGRIRNIAKMCPVPITVRIINTDTASELYKVIDDCGGSLGFEFYGGPRGVGVFSEGSPVYGYMLMQERGSAAFLVNNGFIEDSEKFIDICVKNRLYRLMDEYLDVTEWSECMHTTK